MAELDSGIAELGCLHIFIAFQSQKHPNAQNAQNAGNAQNAVNAQNAQNA